MTDPNKTTTEQLESTAFLHEPRVDQNGTTTHSSKPESNEFQVLIIGAGVTGLLIAHGLKKAGIKYRIFESEPSASHYRPREWSMAIHWSLAQLEALLPDHLVARLDEAKNDPSYATRDEDIMPIVNGETGELMKNVPLPRAIRVSRRKLRAFCSQEIDVEYGKALVSIIFNEDGNGVVAKFANGEEALGSVIIGTDGPKSAVRSTLLGEEKGTATPLEVVHANIALCYGDAEKSRFVRSCHPIFSLCLHPRGLSFVTIQDVPDPDKPETWRFQVVISWIGDRDTSLDNAGRLAELKERVRDWPEPFRSATMWIPDDTPITYDRLSYWIPIPWDHKQGRGTLAGDAAHPMPPHRGQGLNHAICDASHFVSAMTKIHKGEASLEEAVTTYNNELVPRTADEVSSSKSNAFMMMTWDQVKESPMFKGGLQKNKA
ncbi:MAG: hypothetical protein M1812_002734 [Candelaria pacifica]|nr:MAG: hypothetical protein M1812_002734 [Candelaria pacifica]